MPEQNPYERVPVRKVFTKASRVEQNHRDRCNINTILKKCKKTGLLPSRGDAGYYGDFTGVEDFHSNIQRIEAAQQAFMTLPANVRKEFKNDPGMLLDFLSNSENRQKAIELGILPKPTIAELQQQQVAQAS